MAKRKSRAFDGDKPSKKKRSVKRSKKRPKNVKKSYDDRPRLQRVMASAGIGSRRECELIIEEGRVVVDGEVVTKLGIKVDPDKQEIIVDAQKIVIQGMQYFILNKPPGIVSTSKDPSGRARVIDLIRTDQRVYNVGRLDKASEGLILVTNDGELANRLTHPRYGIDKRYLVQVAGIPAPSDLRKLEQGVYLAEGLAKASRCKFVKKAKNGCWLELTLAEGRNREIRRMLASIGHKVRTLKRISIGPLKLGDLPTGAHRRLFPNELRALRKAASGETQKRKPQTKPTRPKRSDSETSEKDSKRPSKGRKVIGRGTGKTLGGRSRSKSDSDARSSSKSRKPSAAGTRGANKGIKKGGTKSGKPVRGARSGASTKSKPKRGKRK
ncbi:MAG: pseudouridine synthase [Mariniblastus sp.]|nr:pseudouridine synthase [Mariniblastus sp.]